MIVCTVHNIHEEKSAPTVSRLSRILSCKRNIILTTRSSQNIGPTTNIYKSVNTKRPKLITLYDANQTAAEQIMRKKIKKNIIMGRDII